MIVDRLDDMKYVGVVVLGLLGACDDSLPRDLPVVPDPPAVDRHARWAVSIPTSDAGGGTGIVIDSHGDVIAAGYSRASAFVTKRAANDGAELWTRTISGSGSFGQLAVLADDSIVSVGGVNGVGFVACYASNGDLRWRHDLDGNAAPLRVVTDSEGRIFVTGVFVDGTLHLGDASYTNESLSDNDTFLAAFDSSGALLWSTAAQGESPGTINGSGPFPGDVAIAPNGDVLLAASFFGPISVEGIALLPDARSRTLIARYRSDGSFVDVHRIMPSSDDGASTPRLAIDRAGHIVVQQTEGWLSTLRVLDEETNELAHRQIENHGSGSPQLRAFAASPEGDIVTSAWTDSPYANEDPTSMTGRLEAIGVEGTTFAMSFVGTRMVGAPLQTNLDDAAVASTGETAYVGTLTGTVAFDDTILEAAPAIDPFDDGDAFIVLVEP